jgi:hypothetical protein
MGGNGLSILVFFVGNTSRVANKLNKIVANGKIV